MKGQRELKIVGKKRLKLMLSSWSMFKYKGKNTVKVNLYMYLEKLKADPGLSFVWTCILRAKL